MALISATFLSRALMRTVEVQVVLPCDKYEGEKLVSPGPYPTLYLLHGIYGSNMDWLCGTRIKRWAEAKGLAVVMPSGENAFYLDRPETGNLYGTFIGRELVEMTRRMFPLSAKREDTFLAGLSMGGFGAIRNGLRYPQTFGAIAGLSSALRLPDGDPVEGSPTNVYFGDAAAARETDSNPRVLVEQLAAKVAENPDVPVPKLFMACGTEDSLLDANRRFRDVWEKAGFSLTYHEGPGSHTWDFWDHWIHEVLEWLPLGEAREGLSSGHING